MSDIFVLASDSHHSTHTTADKAKQYAVKLENAIGDEDGEEGDLTEADFKWIACGQNWMTGVSNEELYSGETYSVTKTVIDPA